MTGLAYKGGLQRSRSKVGGATQRLSVYPIKNGKAKNIFAGDPVRVSNGTLDIGTNTAAVVGVAQSFHWVDDTVKQPVYRNYFPSGTSASNIRNEDFTQPWALVDDDPHGTWIIQAKATVAVSGLGTLGRVQAAGTGSTVTGRSACTVSTGAGVSVTTNAMFRIVGVYKIGESTSSGAVNNDWDSTGGTDQTIVEVVFCNHLYG